MSCEWPTSSCTFAVSASFRCSVGARRIHSRSGRTPMSSEFPCISMNLISSRRYSSGIQSVVSTWPPDCTYSRNSCSRADIWPPNRTIVRVPIVVVVGLLHPGEMGAAVAGQLRVPVVWASAGRSEETRARAARFEDVGTADALAARSDVILSICPPHAAREVAGSVAGFEGIYVDANAIAPATARQVLELFPRGVDGGIVGGPSAPRLYLSGPEA